MDDAQPHYRHQASLEGLFSLGPNPRTLAPDERAYASQRFYQIVGRFELREEDAKPEGSKKSQPSYKRARLVRLMLEYALSDESKDLFLRAFFGALEIPMLDNGEIDDETESELQPLVFGFAEYLMDSFFLPSEKTLPPWRLCISLSWLLICFYVPPSEGGCRTNSSALAQLPLCG